MSKKFVTRYNRHSTLKNFSYFMKIYQTRWYENCSYLPSKVDQFVIYRDGDGDVSGTNKFPSLGGNCSFYHCAPMALDAIKAKKMAVHARKYGMMNYMKNFKFSPNAKLMAARYAKFMLQWNISDNLKNR